MAINVKALLSDIFSTPREEKLQGLLGEYGQMPQLPQGGVDPQQFAQNPQYQPGSPLQQAQMYGGMLDAGYNQQEASGMIGLLNPEQQAAQFSDAYKSPADQLEAVNKLRSPFVSAMKAPRKALNNYNDAVALVSDAEFAENDMLTGAESVALTKKYLKQVLPDESVMGDDIATLLKSQGMPEYMKSFLQSIVGSGTMSRQGAGEVMKAMQTMATSASGQRDLLRTQYTEEAGQYQLPTTFMGERIEMQANPLSFEEWKKAQGY